MQSSKDSLHYQNGNEFDSKSNERKVVLGDNPFIDTHYNNQRKSNFDSSIGSSKASGAKGKNIFGLFGVKINNPNHENNKASSEEQYLESDFSLYNKVLNGKGTVPGFNLRENEGDESFG